MALEAIKAIKDSEAKADDMIKNAKTEISRLEKASEDALLQASRNMLLSFKDSLISELDKIIKSECASSYSKDVLSKLVPETVQAWTQNADASELSVLLSEQDLSSLASTINSALSNGFRIGIKNGEAYYDYSAEAVADLFARYLNPRVASIMKNAGKE